MLRNKLLVVILIVAALLRFVGTKPGYNQFHADEGISYSAAVSMIKNRNLDPLRYDYPALVPLINYVFFKTVFIPLYWGRYYFENISRIVDGTVHIPIAPLEAKKIFQVFILGERERNALFWGRYVTALFSLGNVFLTYLLAKKLFNKKVGLISAFLLAFNYKHVMNSHIGLPDIYNAFFVLLSFLMAVNIWRKPNFKYYLLAGVVAGLSFSVKYQIFGIIPILVAHLFQTIQNRKFDLKKLINFKIVILLLSVPAVFFLINPYHLVNLEEALKILKYVSLKYALGTNKLNLYPFSYFYHVDLGPFEFVLVFAGLGIAIVKKHVQKLLLLLSFLFPLLYFMAYYSNGGFYVRNFINTVPIFLLFAGLAIWQIFELLKRFWGVRAGIIVLFPLLLATVFIPARNAIINSYFYTKPWNYDVMRPWIQNNLPKSAVVASHPFDAVNLGITNKRTEFVEDGAYSLNEHRDNGVDYVLVDSGGVSMPFYFWMSYGFNEASLFWNKPLDMMRNTFPGIVAEELFRYQVRTATKPWQAPDHQLILAKLFNWPVTEYGEVQKYEFDNELGNWSIFGKDNKSDLNYVFAKQVGRTKTGSISFLPSSARYSTARITSEKISVKEGHLYKVSGFLRTEKKLDPSEREGFIRVDFYGENPNLDKVGIITSVSSRVYGTDDCVKKEVVERAPDSAKYLTVSFQVYHTLATKVWLDDVQISESVNRVDNIIAKAPYTNNKIDLNYLYPNSQGNL